MHLVGVRLFGCLIMIAIQRPSSAVSNGGTNPAIPILPREIVISIFGNHLTLRDLIIRGKKVCLAWYFLITENEDLWKVIVDQQRYAAGPI